MIWAAFILGLISSFHCVGMCGPIALTLPVQGFSGIKKNSSILLYHFGRISTYCFFGLFFGLLGRHLFIAGYQQWISIVLGTLILVVIFWEKIFGKSIAGNFTNKISATMGKWMRMVWNKHSSISSFLFGMINGLLPCGMVYYALAGAFAIGSLSGSIYFMLFFGIGTFPMMFAVHLLGSKYLGFSLRNKMKKLVPVFIGVLGIILILRGLNLDIPYISPLIGSNPSQAIICH